MVFRKKFFKVIFNNPTAEVLKPTETSWVKEVQGDIPSEWNTRYQRLGPSRNDEDIVVRKRISKWLKDNWSCNSFTLLTCKHPFSKLYILHLHNIDHAGTTDVTLAKLQSKYWIPGARRELKSIKNECIRCRN